MDHTYVKTFTSTEFANPFLVCNQCGGRVTSWAQDSDAPGMLFPCEHYAGCHSVCPSWGPVDGCECQKFLGYVPHEAA